MRAWLLGLGLSHLDFGGHRPNTNGAHAAMVLACALTACGKPTEPAKAVNTTIQAPSAKAAPAVMQPASAAPPTTPARLAKEDPKADRYSDAYDICMKTDDAAGGVTAAMMDCIGAEISVQDGLLNTKYKAAMAQMANQSLTDKLRSDERLWIKSRDEKCKASAAEEEGGSMWSILYNDCILDATIERSDELSRMPK